MKIFFSLSDIRLIQRILIHTNIIFYNQLKTGFITGYLLKTKGKMALGDFNEAMGFVTRVGIAAEVADHHPDIDIRWNKVTLVLSTHSESALTNKDTGLARECDRFAANL